MGVLKPYRKSAESKTFSGELGSSKNTKLKCHEFSNAAKNKCFTVTRATLRDKSDFSKNSHSTETNFNYLTNFESAKNVRSSNIAEFELHHIPSSGMEYCLESGHSGSIPTVSSK